MEKTEQRIILKLSGEALGENGVLFSHAAFDHTAKMLVQVQQSGVQLAVVIGGGNVWRGRRGPAMRMGAVAADQMGMLATLQNSLYMCDALRRMGASATLMSAVDIHRFAEPYNSVRAVERMAQGHILLIACGTGNPFFSTDTAVVLRAIELSCDAIYMAKNIDGVYTADPHVDPTAELIPDATYDACTQRNLRAMDPGAFVLLHENAYPKVRVFALEPAENILKVLAGDPMGTTLHP